MRATCPAHVTVLDVVIVTVLVGEYKLEAPIMQ
jgi:hypothetical protein